MGKRISSLIKKAGTAFLLGSALGIAGLYSQSKWETYLPNPYAKRVAEIVRQSPNKYIQRQRKYQKNMNIEMLGEVQVTYFDYGEKGMVGKGDILTIFIKSSWNKARMFKDHNLDGIGGHDFVSLLLEDYLDHEKGSTLTHDWNNKATFEFYNEFYNKKLTRIIQFVEEGK